MGTSLAPVRRRVLAGAFIVGITVALLAPVAAYAANTASFSSRTPASGAQLTSTRPSISVTVYDRYGAHGSGAYSMTVDGQAVSASATYLVTGSWNPLHPNYTRFRLSARPTTALAPGTHKIVVRIRDLKNRISTSSWSFAVKAPAPPYTATFSAPVPANGSSAAELRPSISVTAYDKWGVKSAGTMTIDGTPVTPVRTYSSSGVYTGFKVTYRTPSDLSVGTHVVKVGITDVKAITSSYTWTFTVLKPPLLPMPVSGTACTDCHVGYPALHPMTDCVACHSAAAPSRPDGEPMGSYVPADPSAHTVACATSLCHRGGGTFPHVLDSDCARCHEGDHPGIPKAHAAISSTSVEPYHQSTSAFCVQSGCHVASLTLEHYRRTVGGVPLSCATCHASTDPLVQRAIRDRSTDCQSCHGSSAHTTQHTVTRTDTCAASSCHGSSDTSLVTIHASCAVCHADAASATVKAAVLAGDADCASCHGFTDHNSQHAVTRTDTCAAHSCHGSTDTSLVTIHASCAVCHADTASATTKAAILAGNKDCANCQASPTTARCTRSRAPTPAPRPPATARRTRT